MDHPNRALSDLVAVYERIEGRSCCPDTALWIAELIKAAFGVGPDTDHDLAAEAVKAAFESLVLSPEAQIAEGRSVIVSVDPLAGRRFTAADWQTGRSATLQGEDPRYIVADAPTAFLSDGEVDVQRLEDDMLQIEVPPVTNTSEPGARARLWPGVKERAISTEERNLLLDRLVSTHWRTTNDGASNPFLPMAIAPLSPPGRSRDLDVLDRTALSLPAGLLEGKSPVRFSLDWPYQVTPAFSKNPVLLRRLPPANGQYERDARSDAGGDAAVSLPAPDLLVPGPQWVVSVAVRPNDTVAEWSPCPRNGTRGGSGPTWYADPLRGQVILEALEPNRDYQVRIIVAGHGTARITRGLASVNDKFQLSVLAVPPSSNLLERPAEFDGVQSPAIVSLGDLKQLIARVDPFGLSLSLDPETLTVKRMLALTGSGLALTLNLTVGARAESWPEADLERCTAMIGSLVDRLVPLPAPSVVTIGRAP